MRKMNPAIKWIFACELALVACSQTLPTPHLRLTQGGTCEAACASFEAAGCLASRPDLKGGTCVTRCDAQLRTRATRPLLGCIAAAAGNPQAIELCGERCTQWSK